MENIRIGFIGYGNMATAIAKGLVNSQKIKPEQLYACALHYDKLCVNTKKLGIHALKTASEVVQTCDFIILAVKPYMIREVVEPIKEQLKNKVVISIAAGVYFADYENILLKGTHHISTIPNTPVSVNAGIFVCEATHSLNDNELMLFKSIFNSIALLKFVETKQLSIAGTICGCTPAFTAMYLEALGDAGVLHGLSRSDAYEMSAMMLMGTGMLYLEEKQHPGMMKDAVCSPGGTTIKGVAQLEKSGFRSAIIEAIQMIEG